MDERRDLLVEIGTEELPPAALSGLADAFADGLTEKLHDEGLAGEGSRPTVFATPRRLAVLLRGVAVRQADRDVQKRGPAVKAAFDADGNPTRAAEGFAGSVGARVEDLETLVTDKGDYLVFHAVEKGRDAARVVPEAVAHVLDRLPIPRRMRWGAGEATFVRPVHWVVMLHGDAVIEAPVYGIEAGRESAGHRFHHDGVVAIASPEHYEAALEKAHVIAAFGRRRERIERQTREAAGKIGGRIAASPELLDLVAALTEWPVAITGSFDESFLDLPPEVIATTLEHHQYFFPVADADGRLTNHFIAVSNIDSRDPDQVRQGYERVIRPRLADAQFFFEQDRRTPLSDRREDLAGMLFQKQLGSLHDKSERIEALSRDNAGMIGADANAAARAASLCKCDLVTYMVGEFPELQGVMGGYYAAAEGEDESVCAAIRDHYRPRFAGDDLPSEVTGQVVALADKLDTLVGIFAAGQRPTGNKDPFSLRRAAVGVLRILIEGGHDADLGELIRHAGERLSGVIDVDMAVRGDVYEFIMERLRGYYTESGVPFDVFDAVKATDPSRLPDFDRRIQACRVFRALPEAASLAAANKRIRNILKQAGKSGGGRVDESLLADDEEKRLAEAIASKRNAVTPLIDNREYERALTELAALREPVDAFFDNVMVMTDDERVRDNRLTLLATMSEMFLAVADVSRLSLEAES